MGTKNYYTSTKLGFGGCIVGIFLSFLLAPFRLIILLAGLAFKPILRLIRRTPPSCPTEGDNT